MIRSLDSASRRPAAFGSVSERALGGGSNIRWSLLAPRHDDVGGEVLRNTKLLGLRVKFRPEDEEDPTHRLRRSIREKSKTVTKPRPMTVRARRGEFAEAILRGRQDAQ